MKLKHLHEEGEPLEHEDRFEGDVFELRAQATAKGWDTFWVMKRTEQHESETTIAACHPKSKIPHREEYWFWDPDDDVWVYNSTKEERLELPTLGGTGRHRN
jgi:hypothetical protein